MRSSQLIRSTRGSRCSSAASVHGWLPFLLAYLVYRLGYADLDGGRDSQDSRLLLTAAGARPDAGPTCVNVNDVWGFGDAAPQSWPPARAWLAGLLVGLPVLRWI